MHNANSASVLQAASAMHGMCFTSFASKNSQLRMWLELPLACRKPSPSLPPSRCQSCHKRPSGRGLSWCRRTSKQHSPKQLIA